MKANKINAEVNRASMDENVHNDVIKSLTEEEKDYIVRQAFHHAWGQAGTTPSYDKKAWCYVQKWVDPVYRPSTLAHPDHVHLTKP